MEYQHVNMKKRIDSFKYFRGIEPSSGHRGRTFMGPEYVYTQYILMMPPARVEVNFTLPPIHSRYAMKMINSSFYGTMIMGG